jgi:hypothetical protein
MASGLNNLSTKEQQILESFLGVPLRSLSVFDDILLTSPERKKAEYYLDVLEELWSIQALKERHFDAWITELRSLHSKEVSTAFCFFTLHPAFLGKSITNESENGWIFS